jgi:hypothetical protein
VAYFEAALIRLLACGGKRSAPTGSRFIEFFVNRECSVPYRTVLILDDRYVPQLIIS